VSSLKNSHEQSQDASVTMMANLQDGVQGLTDRLAQQVAQLRSEMKPALQEVSDDNNPGSMN
jgi:gas vesicle protein